jgi:hypothetical protein
MKNFFSCDPPLPVGSASRERRRSLRRYGRSIHKTAYAFWHHALAHLERNTQFGGFGVHFAFRPLENHGNDGSGHFFSCKAAQMLDGFNGPWLSGGECLLHVLFLSSLLSRKYVVIIAKLINNDDEVLL